MDRRHPARSHCSFAKIAEREAQGERHIRLLAPLAFLSPRIIAAIVDGTAPADLTVTGLAKALPLFAGSRPGAEHRIVTRLAEPAAQSPKHRSRNPSHVGRRVCRGCGLRAGGAPDTHGHSANRSLSAIEPVSATAKRKLENGEQRLAPETRPEGRNAANCRPETGARGVTRGNVADFHTPGNNTPETRLPGQGLHQSNCSGSGSRRADRSHVALLSTSRITTSVAA